MNLNIAKSRIAALALGSAAFLGMAGAPSLFAGDLRRDFSNVARENADIRHDRLRLHEDLERGRFRAAERQREDLRYDYARRAREERDIRRDEFRDGYGWR